MNLYIQEEISGQLNKATMSEGGRLLGYNIIYSSDARWKLEQERDIAYGNIGWITGITNHNKLKLPLAGFVPDELKKFAPTFIFSNVNEAYRAIGKFVKPHPEQHKKFNGFVVQKDKPQDTMLTLANYHGEVIIQEKVEYVSEWRIFVLDHEVLDARFYKGTFRITPDWKLADSIASNYKGFGPAWSFDLGITNEGKTHLIECHSMFSLGLYGTQPIFAARVLVQAWDYIWATNK